MKVNIKKLPKGYSVVNGKIVNTMEYGGSSTGDQTNFGLVTMPPLPSSGYDYTQSNDESGRISSSLPGVPREQANLEAEKGETVLTDMNNDGNFELYNIGGNRHHSGGTPLNLPPQSFIFSDTSKMKLDKYELAEMGITSKKKVTPAKVSKGYELNKFIGILDDEHSDNITIDTAEYMLNKNKKSLSQLSFLQEAKKQFEDGVPLASYAYLTDKGINPLQFSQQVEQISQQEAEQKMMMQLPFEQRMQIMMAKEQQAQQQAAMQQQQMMAQQQQMPQNMGQSLAPQQAPERVMPPQGMMAPQQAMPPQAVMPAQSLMEQPMAMGKYGGQMSSLYKALVGLETPPETPPLHLQENTILQNFITETNRNVGDYQMQMNNALSNYDNEFQNRFNPANQEFMESMMNSNYDPKMVDFWVDHINQGGLPPNTPSIEYTEAYSKVYPDQMPPTSNSNDDQGNNITYVNRNNNDNDEMVNSNDITFARGTNPNSLNGSNMASQGFDAVGSPLNYNNINSPYYVGSEFEPDMQRAAYGEEVDEYGLQRFQGDEGSSEVNLTPFQELLQTPKFQGGNWAPSDTLIQNDPRGFDLNNLDYFGSPLSRSLNDGARVNAFKKTYGTLGTLLTDDPHPLDQQYYDAVNNKNEFGSRLPVSAEDEKMLRFIKRYGGDLPMAEKGVEYNGYTYTKKELKRLAKSKDPNQQALYAEIMNGGPVKPKISVDDINKQRVDTEGTESSENFEGGTDAWEEKYLEDTAQAQEYRDERYEAYKARRELKNKDVLDPEKYHEAYAKFQTQNAWLEENLTQEERNEKNWDQGKDGKNKRYKESLEGSGLDPLSEDLISHVQSGYIGGVALDKLSEDNPEANVTEYMQSGLDDQTVYGMSISPEDGIYGNTTNDQREKIAFEEETPGVPCENAAELATLCSEAGGNWTPYNAEDNSGCSCSETIIPPPTTTTTSSGRPDTPFWLQDRMGIANAMDNKFSLKKYYPFAPEYNLMQMDPVFKDPTREIAAIGEQANIAAETASTFAGPQRGAAVHAKSQGVAGKQIADAINKVQSDNVNIANTTEFKNKTFEYRTQVLNNNEQKQLYDNTMLTEQNYDNSLREANAAITKQLQNAYTNAANTDNLNRIYPNFNIDPESGGIIDITNAKDFYADPNYTSPQTSVDNYLAEYNKLKDSGQFTDEQVQNMFPYSSTQTKKGKSNAQRNQAAITGGYQANNPATGKYGREVRKQNLLKKGKALRNWFSPLKGY
tara:strand:+ start:1931 stop:5659 length:3729 start_codon:yes stop_codon:yes gene_type:complete